MKSYFITGLVVILPLLITFFVLIFLLNILTQPFEGFIFGILQTWFEPTEKFSVQMFIYLSRFITFAALLGVILIMGIIGRWFVIHEFLKFSDWIFHRIPLMNKLYRASKETVNALLSSESKNFKQVVLVPFPHNRTLAMGFLTGTPLEDSKTLSIFVPGTPNPTVGFLLLYPKEQVIYLPISIEEGLKFIISCGVMAPEKEKLNHE